MLRTSASPTRGRPADRGISCQHTRVSMGFDNYQDHPPVIGHTPMESIQSDGSALLSAALLMYLCMNSSMQLRWSCMTQHATL